MTELIGQQLGQFKIVDVLGIGGMATVYRGFQESMKRYVAIKVIRESVEVDLDEFIKRFDNEAQTIASLSHPHILKVFEYGKTDNLVFLAMELIKGGSLAKVIDDSDGGLSLDDTIKYLQQIAGALDYAHQRDIIHRDLKPANILLDENGNAVLTDFGIARNLSSNQRLTKTQSTLGTPAYMAPEQWTSDEVTNRTDIYALAVITFEMLTGNFPFDDTALHTLMYGHLQDDPYEVAELRPDIPPQVDNIMQKALSKDPLNRYPNARSFVDDLKALSAGQHDNIVAIKEQPENVAPTQARVSQQDLEATPKPKVKTKPQTSSQSMLVGGAILVIALLGIAGVLFNDNLGIINQATVEPTLEPTMVPTVDPNDNDDLLALLPLSDLPDDLQEGIAYNSVTNDTYDVLWMASDGSDTRFIASGGKPSWTYRDNIITYDHQPFGEDPELFSIEITGILETNLTDNEGILDFHASYSPDGTQIAFHSERNNGNWDVFIMSADGRNVTRLTTDPSNDQWPAWSPDGEWIAFASGRAGGNDIYIIRPDGSDLQQLTDNRANEFYPTWSPDSQRLAYQSNRNGNFDIYTMNIDGTDVTQITGSSANDQWPSWMLNDYILYSSDADGDYEIFAADPVDMVHFQITDNPSNNQYPVWVRFDWNDE
ncbi:MAG: protein kinase [Chloroflexota bacterium]